ncbi:MAG: hypothetical protein AAGG68_00375 [Bacteroidota bacterium]
MKKVFLLIFILLLLICCVPDSRGYFYPRKEQYLQAVANLSKCLQQNCETFTLDQFKSVKVIYELVAEEEFARHRYNLKEKEVEVVKELKEQYDSCLNSIFTSSENK